MAAKILSFPNHTPKYDYTSDDLTALLKASIALAHRKKGLV